MKFFLIVVYILVFFTAQSQSYFGESYSVGQFELVDGTYQEEKNKPNYPGGLTQLSADIYDNGAFVEGTLKADMDYFVPVCLTIALDGSVELLTFTSNVQTPLMDRTIKLFDFLPNWNPAVKRNGQPKQGTICFTLKYLVQEEREVSVYMPPPPLPRMSEPEPITSETVIDFPDVEASFPGDTSSFRVFLKDNMVYPEEAKENGEQGKVFVSFIVEIDGRLTDVKIERGVTWSLDEEAKRLVYLMPNWNPGKSQGKAVRTRERLPIAFTLN